MSTRWTGPLRAVLLAAATAGLVVGAARVPGVVQVAPPPGTAAAAAAASAAPAGAAGSAAGALHPVSAVSLVCPGPETPGLSSVPAAGGSSYVLAAAAPAAALAGATPRGGTGTLVLRTPTGTLAATTARGTVLRAPVTGATPVEAVAAGAVAPGVAALQTWLRTDTDARGLSAAPCQTARAESWLVAGGGQSTRRERLVLVNPGANPVTADVEVLGASGALATSGGQDVAVPPHGRTSLLLDALVGGESSPVVHVTASGGVLGTLLADSWVDGAIPRGTDDAVPSATPSTDLVIPAAAFDGPARLRIAVPGDAETVVQARVLTADGPHPLPVSPVVRVEGRHVLDIDLGSQPTAVDAIELRADHPVVAGLMIERRGAAATDPSDFAWVTSTDPTTAAAGMPLPDGVDGGLVLVATGGAARATVTTVDAKGATSSRTVDVPGDSTVTLGVQGPSQVWVTRVSGTLRAGVALEVVDDLARRGHGPLFTAFGLPPAVVTTAQVPVRRVG